MSDDAARFIIDDIRKILHLALFISDDLHDICAFHTIPQFGFLAVQFHQAERDKLIGATPGRQPTQSEIAIDTYGKLHFFCHNCYVRESFLLHSIRSPALLSRGEALRKNLVFFFGTSG